MAKKPTSKTVIPGHDEGARLTPQEAAALAHGWIVPFLCDDETIGDFLLLLRSICYAKEMSEREYIVNEVEKVLLPYAPSIDDALNRLMTERLTVAHSLIKEGGTQ
jgi:hypothetical protein